MILNYNSMSNLFIVRKLIMIKVKLLHSNSFYNTIHYLPTYKYWHTIKYMTTQRLMPKGCYDNGNTFSVDMCKSSDHYRYKFNDMIDYVDKFPYISEPVIDELVKIIKDTGHDYFMFVFLNDTVTDSNANDDMITIRVLHKFRNEITVVIEIANLEHSLKTKRIKLSYDVQED